MEIVGLVVGGVLMTKEGVLLLVGCTVGLGLGRVVGGFVLERGVG